MADIDVDKLIADEDARPLRLRADHELTTLRAHIKDCHAALRQLRDERDAAIRERDEAVRAETERCARAACWLCADPSRAEPAVANADVGRLGWWHHRIDVPALHTVCQAGRLRDRAP